MTCHGIIRSGQTGKSEGRNCWTAKSQTAPHSRPAIKRPEKPVKGFSCFMGNSSHESMKSACIAIYPHSLPKPWAKRTEFYGKNSDSGAGWSETKEMFSGLPEPARVLSQFLVLNVVLKRSKQRLRHPFIISLNWLRRSVIHKAGIYSFLSFLFFFYSKVFKSLFYR